MQSRANVLEHSGRLAVTPVQRDQTGIFRLRDTVSNNEWLVHSSQPFNVVIVGDSQVH